MINSKRMRFEKEANACPIQIALHLITKTPLMICPFKVAFSRLFIQIVEHHLLNDKSRGVQFVVCGVVIRNHLNAERKTFSLV